MKKYALALLTIALALPITAAETAPAKKPGIIDRLKKKEGSGTSSEKVEAEKIASALTPAQKTKLMEIINKGDEPALISLPGIGATRAAAIKKARPVAQPADLVDVEGIGTAMLSGIVAHAKAGFPASKKPEAATAKTTEPKKPAAKKPATDSKAKSAPKAGSSKAPPSKAATKEEAKK